ncbi:MAG TPA: DUF1254 domain-containing protein [Verrucomicrobiae bacterium]|nr:DUF1254 domain-containing protein [Verrucomicrobiae bacterium]
MNQLAKMPTYVSPDFKNVVRISLNSLWTTGWLDLEKEPIALSIPDTKHRYRRIFGSILLSGNQRNRIARNSQPACEA